MKIAYVVILSFICEISLATQFNGYIVKKRNAKNFEVVTSIPNGLASIYEHIEPNYIIKLDVPNTTQMDPTSGWHLDKIGLDANIEKSSQYARPLTVAVIDSGMQWDHPDLANHLYTNFGEIPNNGIDDDGNGYIDDVHGFNFVAKNGNSYDDNGHGTHVSGLIAADCNQKIGTCGIMRNVKILPLKFLTREGQGDTAAAIAAINYAVKMKVDIINASWGSEENSDALKAAIQDASNHGIIFVTASGNYGSDNDVTPMYPASYPINNIVSVAATDQADILDDFSNYGDRSVLVAAPGKNIVSTYLNSRYQTLSGTSMATPIVTGVIGLLKQYHPQSSIQEIKNALVTGCDQNASLFNKVICAGRVNLKKSLGKFIK